MLPTPLISDWSSSARLIPVFLVFSSGREPLVVEGGLERIRRDVRDQAGQLGSARRERQVPERALIDEPQVMAAVAELEPGAQMRPEWRLRIPDQQLAAHAQVSQQRVLADGEPQVLAAPAHFPDLPVGERGGEILWPGHMTAGPRADEEP